MADEARENLFQEVEEVEERIDAMAVLMEKFNVSQAQQTEILSQQSMLMHDNTEKLNQQSVLLNQILEAVTNPGPGPAVNQKVVLDLPKQP